MFHPARYPTAYCGGTIHKAFSTVQVIAPVVPVSTALCGADVQDWLTHPSGVNTKCDRGFMVSVGFIAMRFNLCIILSEFSDILSF